MGSDLVELPELELTEDGKVVDGSELSASDENTNGEREHDATPPQEDREQGPAKNDADTAGGDAGATDQVHDAAAATATGGDVVDTCASEDGKENQQPAEAGHGEGGGDAQVEGTAGEPVAEGAADVGEAERPGESAREVEGRESERVVVEECQVAEGGGSGVEVTEECPKDDGKLGQDNHDDGSVVGGVRVEEEGERSSPPPPPAEPTRDGNPNRDEGHGHDQEEEQNNHLHQEEEATAEGHEEAKEAIEVEAKEPPEEAKEPPGEAKEPPEEAREVSEEAPATETKEGGENADPIKEGEQPSLATNSPPSTPPPAEEPDAPQEPAREPSPSPSFAPEPEFAPAPETEPEPAPATESEVNPEPEPESEAAPEDQPIQAKEANEDHPAPRTEQELEPQPEPTSPVVVAAEATPEIAPAENDETLEPVDFDADDETSAHGFSEARELTTTADETETSRGTEGTVITEEPLVIASPPAIVSFSTAVLDGPDPADPSDPAQQPIGSAYAIPNPAAAPIKMADEPTTTPPAPAVTVIAIEPAPETVMPVEAPPDEEFHEEEFHDVGGSGGYSGIQTAEEIYGLSHADAAIIAPVVEELEDEEEEVAQQPRRHKSRHHRDDEPEEGRRRHKTPEERAARKAKKAAEKLAIETGESPSDTRSQVKRKREYKIYEEPMISAPVEPYTPTPSSRKSSKRAEVLLGMEPELGAKERRRHRKRREEELLAVADIPEPAANILDVMLDTPDVDPEILLERGERKRKHRKEKREKRSSRGEADMPPPEDLREGRVSRKAAGIKNGAEVVRTLSRSRSRTRSPEPKAGSGSRHPAEDLRPDMAGVVVDEEPPVPQTNFSEEEARESRRRRRHKERRMEDDDGAEEPRHRRHRSKNPVDDTDAEPREHRHKSKTRVRSMSRHVSGGSEVAEERHHRSRRKHGSDEVKEERRHRQKDKDREREKKEKKSRSKSRHLDDEDREQRKVRRATKTVARLNGPVPIPASMEPQVQPEVVPAPASVTFEPEEIARPPSEQPQLDAEIPSAHFVPDSSFLQEPSPQEIEALEIAHKARRAERRARKQARTEEVLKDSGHSLSSEGKKEKAKEREKTGRNRSKSFSTPEEEEEYRMRKEARRARRQVPGEGVDPGYLSPVDGRLRKGKEREKVAIAEGATGRERAMMEGARERDRGDRGDRPRTRPRRKTDPTMERRSKKGVSDAEESSTERGGFFKKAFSKFLRV